MVTFYEFCDNCRQLKLGVFISNKNEITLCMAASDNSDNHFMQKRLFYTKPLKKYHIKNSYFGNYVLNSEKFSHIYKKFVSLSYKRNFKKHLNNILKYAI